MRKYEHYDNLEENYMKTTKKIQFCDLYFLRICLWFCLNKNLDVWPKTWNLINKQFVLKLNSGLSILFNWYSECVFVAASLSIDHNIFLLSKNCSPLLASLPPFVTLSFWLVFCLIKITLFYISLKLLHKDMTIHSTFFFFSFICTI